MIVKEATAAKVILNKTVAGTVYIGFASFLRKHFIDCNKLTNVVPLTLFEGHLWSLKIKFLSILCQNVLESNCISMYVNMFEY